MRKIFTLLAAFLAIAGSAVWGQNTSGEGWSYNEATKTLTIMGDNARGFSSIEDIENVVITADVTELATSIFDGNKTLKSVTFQEPSKLTELPFYIFGHCENLTSIELPASMQKLGENCFYNSGLTSIVIPKGVTEICNNAFRASDNLASITFEEGSQLTTIGSGVFDDQSLVIPAGVTSVGSWFLGNETKRVEFTGTIVPKETWMDEADSTRLPIENENCIIVVPDAATEVAFKADEVWGQYPNIFAKGTEPKEGSVPLIYDAKNIKKEGLPEWVFTGDTFTIYPIDGYDNLQLLTSSSAFELTPLVGENDFRLPCLVTVNDVSNHREVYLSMEAYELALEEKDTRYYFDPSSMSMLADFSQLSSPTISILPKVRYTDGKEYEVKRIKNMPAYINTKHLIVPETVEFIDSYGFGNPGDEYKWETIEFLGTNPPEVEVNETGLTMATTILVPNEEAKKAFEASEAFKNLNIVVNTKTKVEYAIKGSGSIAFSYDGKPAASYEEIPAGVTSITVEEAPLMGSILNGKITITEGETETEVSSGDTYTLLGQGSLSIAATFVKDGGNTAAADSLDNAPAVETEITEVVAEPTVIAESSAFETEGSAEVKIVSTPVAEATSESIINTYKQENPSVSIPEDGQTYALDITPMYISSDEIKEATINAGESVSLAFPYPEGLGMNDFEDIAVLHMKKNGEFEYFSETNDNLERKETHIELSGITSFSPFVLIYTKAEVDPEPEPPVFTTYYDLYITQSIGAKLVSRHGKDQVEEGGSFTLSLEKEEGYEDCNPTVYVKRGRSGEWQEVKLDEVSGYYQIRDVYTDIYVKVSGDGIYPVGNESIETSDTKVYSFNGKIVVETAQPKEVYVVTLAGAVVANAQVVGKQTFDNLATGVYIVRAGETIVKLQVRN